ncbi:MAG TPA: S24/S26 family peptidase [Terriglobia bacterium]|nr:S24/S26 family peptidase [Terriglobia bacterium]
MRTDHGGNASIELACGLAGEVVRTFGGVRLRVTGTSMVPSILPGDFVSVLQASLHEISTGQVVVFLQKGRFVVHRVVDRKVAAGAEGPEGTCLITRGDRLRHDDPPVSSLDFLGRVVSIERGSRKVKLLASGSNHPIVRLLQASDRMTCLYLRLAACWRTLFLRRAKCQA